MIFRKKKDRFSELLLQISNNLLEAGKFFDDFQINEETMKEFSARVKEYETAGDHFVHEMIKELNRAFITPIEREDILALTMSMDDVLDGFEESSALLEMYNITSPTPHMDDFVKMLRKCVTEINRAIELLSENQLIKIRKHAIQIKAIETNCDELLRTAIKELFALEKDPIKIIQYKEIYETLEEIADNCQSVANTLETIIMKNA